MALTKSQEAFVCALVEGKSQRAAYKEAYPNFKGTDKSADECSCRLLKNVKVISRLNELRGKVIVKAEEQAIMTAVDVIKELDSIARDNISNYLDYRTEKTVVGRDGNGNPIAAYATICDLKDSQTVDTKNISEITLTRDGTLKFKLYNKMDALDKLGKYYGLFNEKVKVEGTLSIENQYKEMTDADLRELAKRYEEVNTE